MAIRKIDLMHKMFGLSPTEDDTCIKCKNFIHNKGGYSKCRHYGYTHSEASDWKQKQRGCGLFNKDYTGRKVIALVSHDRRIEESEIEGQMTLFDYMKMEEDVI